MAHDETGWRPLRHPPVTDSSPLGSSPFARLALTHAFTVAGDTLVTLCLAGSLFFSISPSAARGRVALSLVVTMAPFAIVAPLLGPAIDARHRGGRRALLVAASLARAVACLVVANVLHSLLLFPAAFALLVLSKAHTVAKSSLVPAVVRSHAELVEANAKLALSSVLVGFVVAGPGVGVLKVFGAPWVARGAALAFVAAGAAAARITIEAAAETEVEPESDLAEASMSKRSSQLSTDPAAAGIRLAAVAMAILRGGVGFLTFLVAFSLRRAGAPSWVFGLVLAASMAGTLVGATLAPVLRRSLHEERMLGGGVALVVLAGAAAARLGGRAGAVVLALALGAAASAAKLAFDALVQRDAPASVQGRAFARFESVFQLTWVLGALVPVAVVIPLRAGFVTIAVAELVAMAVFGWGRHVAVRQVRRPAASQIGAAS